MQFGWFWYCPAGTWDRTLRRPLHKVNCREREAFQHPCQTLQTTKRHRSGGGVFWRNSKELHKITELTSLIIRECPNRTLTFYGNPVYYYGCILISLQNYKFT
nr:hypothetical protein [Oscillospiraceae bacterium]